MTAGPPMGNKNATKNKPWSEAIAKFAVQNPNKRDKVIEKLYEQALEGKLDAIKEIMDRTEGKPKQSIDVTHDLSQSTLEELKAELASIDA
jgi:hypothetical protein